MAAKLFSKQSLVTKLQSTILQSQSLELDTKVIVVNVVIGGFSGENQKMIGSCNCLITGVGLEPTVRLH